MLPNDCNLCEEDQLIFSRACLFWNVGWLCLELLIDLQNNHGQIRFILFAWLVNTIAKQD
jgi:hypothetical protein